MSELTEQEKQYFETGGEVEITETPPEPEPQPEPQAAQPAASAPAEGQGEVKLTDTEHSGEHKSDPPEIALEKVNKALKESRVTNRELRAQLQQYQSQNDQMMRQIQQIQARLDPQAQNPPTMETDPASYLKQKVETTEQELARIKQTEQQRAQLAQFQQWYGTQAQQFRSQQADFDQAYAHYNRTRVEQLQEAGLTHEQAAARLQFEEMQLATTAAQSGLNPAQMIYQLAHARGYRNTPAAPAKPQQTAETLKQVRAGVESSKPLSAVGGGGQSVNLTWETVANMPSGPEFQKYFEMMLKQEGQSLQ